MDSSNHRPKIFGGTKIYTSILSICNCFFAIVLKQCSIAYIISSIELLAINNQPVTYEEAFLFYMQTRHHFAFETQTSTVFSFCGILKSMCTNEKNYTYSERKQRCPESSGRERKRVGICGFRVAVQLQTTLHP